MTSENDMNQFETHIDQFMLKKLPPLQFLEKAINFRVTRDNQKNYRLSISSPSSEIDKLKKSYLNTTGSNNSS